MRPALQVLREAQVVLEGVVDGEADGGGGHHLHVIKAEAGEERARPLLRHYQPQPLQRRPDLRGRLRTRRKLCLQPLHLLAVAPAPLN